MGASKHFLAGLAIASLLQTGSLLAQPAPAHGEHASRPASRTAQAPWTPQPMLRAAGRPGDRGVMPFAVSGFAPESVQVFGPLDPDRPRTPMFEQGRWSVSPDEGGGFHWIEAVQRQPGHIVRASTVWSFSGKGASPAALLQRRGEGLEIRPVRIPERGGYRESSSWDFRLILDGQPLSGHDIALLTENGTRQTFKSDATGIVSVTFPRDFSPESIDPEQGAARTRKAYLLEASLQQDGQHLQTSFSYFYTPDLMRERSLGWGMGFMALGMLLAVPLLRRRQGASHA